MSMGHSPGARYVIFAVVAIHNSQFTSQHYVTVHHASVAEGSMASTASSSSSSSAGAAVATGGKKKNSKKRKSFGSAQAHVDISLEEAEDAADAMESRAISDDCKAKYATMVRALKDFLASKYPHLLEDGELPCPIPVQGVKAFFGTLTKAGSDLDKLKGREELDPNVNYPTPLSHSHVRTHGSAILNFYNSHNIIKCDDAVATAMKQQIGSYYSALHH